MAVCLAACNFAGEPVGPDTRLRILAASSLNEVLWDVAAAYRETHPDVGVYPSFAGSQTLRLQVERGVSADIYAAAEASHMQRVDSLGLVYEPHVFAYNELAVIVPLENPAGIESLQDLPSAERLVIGVADVPIGRYTRVLLERAREAGVASPAAPGVPFDEAVMAKVVSQEVNVRQVRAKVELGEADAAIVYRTDAIASSGVRTIRIPREVNVRAAYVVAVLKTTDDLPEAEAWVDLLLSDTGRAALLRRGFFLP